MYGITTERFNDILAKHTEWVNSHGVKGVRANLSGADLSGADLKGANLRGADLWCASLWNANLRGANLGCTNLGCADLSGADLRGAILEGADLRSADLNDADLTYTNLKSANLSGVDLEYANLDGADLRYADLRCANLWGADLWCVDLRGAKINFHIACPEKGSFIAFKKAGNNYNNYIVELLIPEDARRCSATSKKCRCDKAKVLSITKLDGTSDGVDTVYSLYDETFAYKIGETVEVKNFDNNRWNECSTGIHFFLTRQEAVEY